MARPNQPTAAQHSPSVTRHPRNRKRRNRKRARRRALAGLSNIPTCSPPSTNATSPTTTELADQMAEMQSAILSLTQQLATLQTPSQVAS